MWMRIAGVTLGLSVAGFVTGGIVGTVMLATWAGGPLLPRNLSFLLLYGGTFGGCVGAVIGPAAAWLLMRSVPLGLAVGGTALGTLAGSVVGLLAASQDGSFLGSLLGFGAAAVALRIGGSRARRAGKGPGIARAPHGV